MLDLAYVLQGSASGLPENGLPALPTPPPPASAHFVQGSSVRSSIMVSGAGSAPERSRIARLFALSTVKPPDIWPEPPRIGSRAGGAGHTHPARATGRRAPALFSV